MNNIWNQILYLDVRTSEIRSSKIGAKSFGNFLVSQFVYHFNNYLLFLYLMRFVDAYQKARNQIIKGMCKKESHPCRQQYMKLREMILDKNVPVTDKR